MKLEEAALFSDWEKAERPYPWTKIHFEETLSQTGVAQTFVLEIEKEVVAFAVVQIVGHEGYLQNMMVARNHRRHGYGSELLQKVIMRAVEQGVNQITLDVDANNQSAIALYEKIGFKILQRRKSAYPKGEDALLMGKNL